MKICLITNSVCEIDVIRYSKICQSFLLYNLFYLLQQQVKSYLNFHIKEKVSMVTMFDSNNSLNEFSTNIIDLN